MRASAAALLAAPLAAAFSTAGLVASPPWGAIAASPAAVSPLPALPALPSVTADGARLLSAVSGFLRARHEADDFFLAMVSPGAYWLLRDWRRRAFGSLPTSRRTLERARRDIHSLGAAHPVLRGATVSVRTKGLWSTFHKAAVRNQKVNDVLAVRVVLRKGLDADACFEAHGALRALWPSAPLRFKDHVSVPKENGYRALHDTLVLPSNHPFEVQIRTDAMHRVAEYGSAAHRRYKGSLATLPLAILSGVAAPSAWPLQPQAALNLATRLAVA